MLFERNEMDSELDPNSGEYIVDWLRKTGSDLEREHEFFFYMYFPRERWAREAGDCLRRVGMCVDVDASTKEGEWLCLVACPQIPERERLDRMVNFFRAVCSEFYGNFDGWESSLEV